MFGRHRNGDEAPSSSDDGASNTRNSNEIESMEEGRNNNKKMGSWRRRNKKKQLDNIPARRTIHKVFIMIALLTTLCALGMAAGQIMGIIVYENTVVTYVLRAYVILLCFLVVFIEVEWPTQIRETFLFRHWFTRGLFYTFIGVVGMQENETSEIVLKKESEAYETVSEISIVLAWNMVGCGLLYSLMGVLCLHYLLTRYRQDYQERLQGAEQDAEEDGDNSQDGSTSDEEKQKIAIQAAQSAFAEDKKASKQHWSKEKKEEDDNKKEKHHNINPEPTSWAIESDDDVSATEKSSAGANDDADEVKVSGDNENDQQPSWAEDDDELSAGKSSSEVEDEAVEVPLEEELEKDDESPPASISANDAPSGGDKSDASSGSEAETEGKEKK